MKKNEFLALGLDEEMATKAEAAVAEHLKGFIPKARFDEVNGEKNTLAATVKERDKQLDDLKKSTDVGDLKKQIEELQAANTKKDEEHAAAIKALKIDTAIEAALTTARAKNIKAVRGLLDLDDADLAKDGTVKGLADQIKKLVEGEDTSFLFEAEPDADSKVKFTPKGAKPAESRVETPDGKVDFTKMTYEEMAAYLEANPNAEIPKVNPLAQAQATTPPMTQAQAIAAAVAEAISKGTAQPQAQNFS